MTPTARISLDGKDITTRLLGGGSNCILESLTITDEAGIKSDSLELVIDNRENFPAPPKGAMIQVWLGYEPEPVYMGKYRVDEWSKSGKPNVLRVSAKAAELTTAIKGTKTRSWHDKTVKQIVTKIAGEHGLGTAIDQAIGARQVEHIDQQTESDMGFLTRLAGRNGATFKLADGKIIFAAKGSKTLPGGGTKSEVVLKPADVSTWSVTSSERGGHKSVVCSYQDHAANKRVSVTAGDGKPAHRDKKLYRTKSEAEAAAKAKLGELTRGKKEGQVDGPGNPAIFAEGVVRLEGFDPDCDGSFFAKSVTHSFSGSGAYTTSITLETEKSDPDE